MKNYLFILIGIMFLFSLTFVSAESIGEFRLGDNVQIFQTCNNCTQCDFTRVIDSDKQIILSNIDTTKDGTFFYYNITSPNFTKVGDYSYCYNCGNLVENSTGCIDFKISYTGDSLNGVSMNAYFMAIFILIFLFGIILLSVRQLPNTDSTDEEGTILQVSNLKHLRPVLYGCAWACILGLLFTVSNITLAYLPTYMFGNLFFNIYTICFWMTIVAMPLWFIWIFVKVFKDVEMKKLIERGVDVKSFRTL
jgi:hypothetical protein